VDFTHYSVTACTAYAYGGKACGLSKPSEQRWCKGGCCLWSFLALEKVDRCKQAANKSGEISFPQDLLAVIVESGSTSSVLSVLDVFVERSQVNAVLGMRY
jgi:hypothetical protein